MLFCLLQESPLIDTTERKEIDTNQSATAHHGREPNLKLNRNGKPVRLSVWATEIFTAMRDVSEFLDSSYSGTPYQIALDELFQSIQDPDLTPSARILSEMTQKEEPFFPFSMRYAEQNATYFESLSLSNEKKLFFEKAASKSLVDQQQMVENDQMDFPEFLQRYFSETLD